MKKNKRRVIQSLSLCILLLFSNLVPSFATITGSTTVVSDKTGTNDTAKAVSEDNSTDLKDRTASISYTMSKDRDFETVVLADTIASRNVKSIIDANYKNDFQHDTVKEMPFYRGTVNYSPPAVEGESENTEGSVKEVSNQVDTSEFIDIACGLDHSLALKSDGTVWTWGNNNCFQLGRTISSSWLGNENIPGKVEGLSDVVQITAGVQHSMALKKDGTVWTWGRYYLGQLGENSITNSEYPVKVMGLTDVIAISGGYHHSIALKKDGTVWAWGDNQFGQLGNGSQESSTTPVQTAMNDVIAISSGSDFNGCHGDRSIDTRLGI